MAGMNDPHTFNGFTNPADLRKEFAKYNLEPRTLEEIIAEHPEGPGECKATFTEMSCEEHARDDITVDWWPDELI